MRAKRTKTRTPGIYKRGDRYTFAYTLDGRKRWESGFRTLDEARRAKHAREADVARGEFEGRSRITLHDYASEWVERYQGRGRKGFREGTRDGYRQMLNRYTFRYFSRRLHLTDLTPAKVAEFVAWMCQQRGGTLSDSTVKAALTPLRSCLATAVREGLIRSNPARETDLPTRQSVEDAEQ